MNNASEAGFAYHSGAPKIASGVFTYHSGASKIASVFFPEWEVKKPRGNLMCSRMVSKKTEAILCAPEW
jgi:hypothetical protein